MTENTYKTVNGNGSSHTADEEPDHLISTGTAAARLHLKPQTLAKWRSAGTKELPFFRLGNRIWYDERDVEAYRQSTRAVQANHPKQSR